MLTTFAIHRAVLRRDPPIKRGTLKGSECLEKRERGLLGAEDRVLGRLGHAEFHDALGFDLDGRAGGRIAAGAGFAIHQNQFAQAGQGESIFGMLVCQLGDGFQNLHGGFLGEIILGCDFGGDL